MKKCIFTLVSAAVFLCGCGGDSDEPVPGPAPGGGTTGSDDLPNYVNDKILQAFTEGFPGATDVQWYQKEGGGIMYVVATFTGGQTKEDLAMSAGRNSAWYDNNGNWYMTEFDHDTRLEKLPQAVRDAFLKEYDGWTIDDIDEIRRSGVETVYVIEVEKDEVEMSLYYSEDGVLVKKLADADPGYDYGDYIPPQSTGSITDFIETHYPGARIIEIDRENGMTEVEIVDGNICREVLFNSSDTWMHTKTEYREDDVPKNVKSALLSKYPGTDYRIDDIDHYETPDRGNFFRFELKSYLHEEVKVEIDENGEIKNEYNPGAGNSQGGNQGGSQGGNQSGSQGGNQGGDQGGSQGGDQGGSQGGNQGGSQGGIVSQKIKDFIEENYPGARIVERDYDDGFIEVEIIHEGREKDVYFNGAENWVRTRWDLRENELPANVRDAALTRYRDKRIDDAEYVDDSSLGEYYVVELDPDDIELRIRENGEIFLER